VVKTFQAFCEEPGCPWSSSGRDRYELALGAIEDHLRSTHDITDTTKAKFEIDEREDED
jgi:predicted small metal-binding protein